MSTETELLINEGMQCLENKLGIVGTERFIALIMREKFDYTKWQREHFDGYTSDVFNEKAAKYDSENPW